MTPLQEPLAADLGLLPVPRASAEVGIEDHLVVVVEGAVRGQGSKKMVPGNRFIDDNDKTLRPWRQAIKAAATEAIREMYPEATRPLFPRGTPVDIAMTFTFRRPRSHYGTGRNFQTVKASAPTHHIGFPDCDKAQRAILDSFTQAGVWDDDKQAVICRGFRVYPGTFPDSLDIPGAVIRVRALQP